MKTADEKIPARGPQTTTVIADPTHRLHSISSLLDEATKNVANFAHKITARPPCYSPVLDSRNENRIEFISSCFVCCSPCTPPVAIRIRYSSIRSIYSSISQHAWATVCFAHSLRASSDHQHCNWMPAIAAVPFGRGSTVHAYIYYRSPK